MSYLPLVMYTTTSIMMPTLLNINAVNWRQWSLARSANGGLGKLCRLRNDLNDLCRSIVRVCVFHSFSLEFDDHKQIMLYRVLQCVNITKNHAPLFADRIFCLAPRKNMEKLFKSANKIPFFWFAHNSHFNCVDNEFMLHFEYNVLSQHFMYFGLFLTLIYRLRLTFWMIRSTKTKNNK